MQVQVTKVVCLSSTNFEFHLLDTAAVTGDNANATIEVFLGVEVFGIFEGVARQTEVLDAVETEDDVSAFRSVASHHIPTLTKEFHA